MNGRNIMSFWDLIRPMMSDSKSVDAVLVDAENLDKDDYETSVGIILPKLLAEEMLMQELRVGKSNLLRFLSRKEVIGALVDYVIDGCDDVARTSFEILNFPDESMMLTIVGGAIEKLLTFLKTPCDVSQKSENIDRACRLLTTYIHKNPSACFLAFDQYDSFNEFVDACCGGGHLSGNEHIYSLFQKGFLRPEGVGESNVLDALSSLLVVGEEFDDGSAAGREDPALRLQYNTLLSKQDFVDRLSFQLLESKKMAELSQSNVAELLVSIASDKSRSVLYTDLCGWVDTFIAEAFALVSDLDRVDQLFGYFLRTIFKILSLVATNTFNQSDQRLDRDNFSAIVKRGYPRHKEALVSIMMAQTEPTRLDQNGKWFAPCTETRIQAIKLHGEIVRLMVRRGEGVNEQILSSHIEAVVNVFANYERCGLAHQVATDSYRAIASEMAAPQRQAFTDELRDRLLEIWNNQRSILSKLILELLEGSEDERFSVFRSAMEARDARIAKYKSITTPEHLIGSLYETDDGLDQVERSQSRRIFDFMIEPTDQGNEDGKSQLTFERLMNFNMVGTNSIGDEFDLETNSIGSSDTDDGIVPKSDDEDAEKE